jgi:hypothetical protein
MDNLIYKRDSEEDGLSVSVFKTDKGFRVIFIDTDSDNVIENRGYYKDEFAAVSYASTLIND